MAADEHANGGGDRLERHKSLWLSDGNIVLVATSSSDSHLSILFRVHKSVLSRQSQVFSDMFASPDNSSLNHVGDEKEILEGLPLVRMHDSAEDIEALLKYLYDPVRDVAFTQPRHPDFQQKSQVLLRLADKYGLDNVKDGLIEIFKSHWPKSIKEWRYAEMIRDTLIGQSYSVATWPEELLPEPITAALMAMQYNVKEMLPYIFYELHRCRATVDWDTQTKTGDKFKPDERGARWNMATAKILHIRNIVAEKGEQRLRNVMSDHYADPEDWGINSLQICIKGEVCRPILASKHNELLLSRDWLKTPQRIGSSWYMSSGICQRCQTRLASLAIRFGAAMWNDLVKATS